MTHRPVKSDKLPKPVGPYSPGMGFERLVFVSGQASVDATGKIISDTFEGEMRRSIKNLEKVLKSAGSDLAHVVQTRNYVRDGADLADFNRIYPDFFKEPYPARTTITNCLSASLRYEIECIAVVRAGD